MAVGIQTKGSTVKRTIPIAVALVAAAVLGAGVFALVGSGSKTVVRQVTVAGALPAAQTSTSSSSVTNVADSSLNGVVEITVSSSAGTNPYGGQEEQQALGSGFVYDSNGDIITNDHVVAGAQSITVRFSNGQTFKGTLVGADPSTDLAVVKVSAPSSLLHPLALGDSDTLQVGQGVVAIGSPYGLQGTVTAGIVSALHREMTAPNNYTIPDSIQTDAAINHGNSGGPLLDLSSKVVGVNAQIDSDSGDNSGVGFAIPSNTVRSIATQLISTGSVHHAYLGVGITNGSNGGAKLTEVRPGTPAANAGLQVGDVITKLDGDSIADATALGTAVDAKKPGDSVTITYVRNGSSHTVTVTLGTRPS